MHTEPRTQSDEYLGAPLDREARFWARVSELGARPDPDEPDNGYVNTTSRVSLICEKGHKCRALPSSVSKGVGVCKFCAANRTATVIKARAESAFWTRVAELGATAQPDAVYTDSSTKVQLVCERGHRCAPTPSTIQQGQGICRDCVGTSPKQAEANFWRRVAEFGGRPDPDPASGRSARYMGSHNKVALICKKGHKCQPSPAKLSAGQGICRKCAQNDRAQAEANFWARVAELGASPDPNPPAGYSSGYTGNRAHVALICAKGHRCHPRPTNVQSGWGVCRTCAKLDPVQAEANFWARISEMEARADPTPGPGRSAHYRGSHNKVALICKNGHECYSTPATVSRGNGICRKCVGATRR